MVGYDDPWFGHAQSLLPKVLILSAAFLHRNDVCVRAQHATPGGAIITGKSNCHRAATLGADLQGLQPGLHVADGAQNPLQFSEIFRT